MSKRKSTSTDDNSPTIAVIDGAAAADKFGMKTKTAEDWLSREGVRPVAEVPAQGGTRRIYKLAEVTRVLGLVIKISTEKARTVQVKADLMRFERRLASREIVTDEQVTQYDLQIHQHRNSLLKNPRTHFPYILAALQDYPHGDPRRREAVNKVLTGMVKEAHRKLNEVRSELTEIR
jgi:hypothetical protein